MNKLKKGKLQKTELILGIDPSLVATGWAVVSYASNSLKLIASGYIPTHREHAYSVSVDDMLRAEEIASELKRIAQCYRLKRLSAEIPVGSQSAKAAKALGIAKGLVASLNVWSGILENNYVSPYETKTFMTGKRTAKKYEMIAAVEKRLPIVKTLDNRLNRNGKFTSKHEAICDAIAVVLTTLAQEKE